MKPGCLFITLLLLLGCQSHNALVLELSHSSSDSVECAKVFSRTRKEIVELNQILLQTGYDEQRNRVAGIHVAGQFYLLKLSKSSRIKDLIRETYEGNGYTLKIDYQTRAVNGIPAYYGNYEIIYQGVTATEDIEGMPCRI